MHSGRILAALAVLSAAGMVQAAVIDFESPYTTAGTLAAAYSTGGVDLPFSGQQGWSNSADYDLGKVVTTATSGLYVGGHALSTTAAGYNYQGAKQSVALGSAFTFDLSTASTNKPLCVGRWQDADSDGLYDKSETGLLAGLFNGYTNGPATFGLRDKGYGTTHFTTVAPTASDWYRVTVTLDDSTYTATMDVLDLTTNTVVDLNGAAAGTAYSYTFTAGTYGPLDNATNGVAVRVADMGSFIDNIGPVAVVPEPASLALLGLGSLALLKRRRA